MRKFNLLLGVAAILASGLLAVVVYVTTGCWDLKGIMILADEIQFRLLGAVVYCVLSAVCCRLLWWIVRGVVCAYRRIIGRIW